VVAAGAPWGSVPHGLLHDQRLGFDTRAVAAILAIRPAGSRIIISELITELGLGRERWRRAARELKAAGYLTMRCQPAERGRWLWTIEFCAVPTVDGFPVDGEPVDKNKDKIKTLPKEQSVVLTAQPTGGVSSSLSIARAIDTIHKTHPPAPAPHIQFREYADAVGAERFRVTCIKMHPDGSKQTFILDKRDGVTRGFTPQEIEQRTLEMLRLQRRGENIYYTPLSDKKHHILIDDMNLEKLERLIQDGYRPAVVLESSPGSLQAVITVPKLGTPHDRDVGNRLSDALNHEYGDLELSGAIHPHRAPGYENRKPIRRRGDGSYPEVRLILAERRECGKTLELSRQIDAEYQRQAALKAQQPERSKAKPALGLAAASGSAVEAYRRHYLDVLNLLKRQGGDASDLSRVDSMIAVRMRVTGHHQIAIESAIRESAPSIRKSDEGRDWSDYAQRTARYAYSAAGDRQAEELAKYKRRWKSLEMIASA
jgi:hypothetical protein